MDLEGEPFITWNYEKQPYFCEGMFCTTLLEYDKGEKWYLDEVHYDPINEENSTWKIIQYQGKFPEKNNNTVMKYFKLEKDEWIIARSGKERPVVLLKKTVDDWWNPINKDKHETYWYCLPIFSYKDRHPQDYVLNDFCLNNPHKFYIPPSVDLSPGISEESVCRFHNIQMINEKHLRPMKKHCEEKEPKMQRPYYLSKIGYEILLYHYYNSLNTIPIDKDKFSNYELFKGEVSRRINIEMAK